MLISRSLCIIALSALHLTVKGQEISVQKPLPFAPFDTMAHGRLLVMSVGHLDQYYAMSDSLNCKLKEVKIGYLPLNGEYYEFSSVNIANGTLPSHVQQDLQRLKMGDKVYLENFVLECQNCNCSKNLKKGAIALKVTER